MGKIEMDYKPVELMQGIHYVDSAEMNNDNVYTKVRPTIGTWTKLTDCLTTVYSVEYWDGKLYCVVLYNIHIYDIATGLWTVDSVPGIGALASPVQTSMQDGTLSVYNSDMNATAYRYNTITKELTTFSVLHANNGMGATGVGTTSHILGGGDMGGTKYNFHDIYDNDGTRSPGTLLTNGRNYPGTCTSDIGIIWVFGGYIDSAVNKLEYLNNNEWVNIPNNSSGKHGHAIEVIGVPSQDQCVEHAVLSCSLPHGASIAAIVATLGAKQTLAARKKIQHIFFMT